MLLDLVAAQETAQGNPDAFHSASVQAHAAQYQYNLEFSTRRQQAARVGERLELPPKRPKTLDDFQPLFLTETRRTNDLLASMNISLQNMVSGPRISREVRSLTAWC